MEKEEKIMTGITKGLAFSALSIFVFGLIFVSEVLVFTFSSVSGALSFSGEAALFALGWNLAWVILAAGLILAILTLVKKKKGLTGPLLGIASAALLAVATLYSIFFLEMRINSLQITLLVIILFFPLASVALFALSMFLQPGMKKDLVLTFGDLSGLASLPSFIVSFLIGGFLNSRFESNRVFYWLFGFLAFVAFLVSSVLLLVATWAKPAPKS